ncbi:MAG: 5-formyltetrahydrofolate cyclo-ligase [Verrucomicrobia bacterium]|nr:5-formyltetrahydrofolate cyclo-ligase [Verrucomicrobiota bacterium]
MNLTISEQKTALRRDVRERSQRFSAEARATDSARLCAQLRAQPVWLAARRVLFFSSTPEEPDIRPLLDEALASGKTVALPRFDSTRREYEARQITSLTDLGPGHFGIAEPGAVCPLIELNLLDFALVPGVAFDAAGRRLGRGKGYFDRLLAHVCGHTCGVAFDWQVVAIVPVEPHDVHLNSILTPSRWIRCAG